MSTHSPWRGETSQIGHALKFIAMEIISNFGFKLTLLATMVVVSQSVSVEKDLMLTLQEKQTLDKVSCRMDTHFSCCIVLFIYIIIILQCDFELIKKNL